MAWVECLYRDIKRGDIFRSYDPHGVHLDPFSELPTDNTELVAIAVRDADFAIGRDEGYEVEIQVFDSLPLALRSVSH